MRKNRGRNHSNSTEFITTLDRRRRCSATDCKLRGIKTGPNDSQ